MYKREFDQLLQNGTLPQSLMIYGDNEYEMQACARLYIDKTDTAQGVLKLYHDEYDFQTAKNHLSQSSLFGDRNLLLIRTDRKIPKKELQSLVELADKNDANRFLYLYTGQDFKSLTSVFSKKARADHLRLFPPRPHEAAAILAHEAQRLGVTIERYALEYLLSLLHYNLAMAVNELEKLALLPPPVTAETIERHVFSLAPPAMDEILRELLSKRPLEALLKQVAQLDEEESVVLRAVQYRIQQLFLFKLHIQLHGAPDSVAVLGYRLPNDILKERASTAVRIPLPLFEKIFDILADGELALKSAGASNQKETLLLSTLIKIKSLFR